jgi:hypothetical protein
MTISIETKLAKAILNELNETINNRNLEIIADVIDNYGQEDFTFELEGCEYRVINSNDIDQIQQDELESDPYILGCFNAWFIADIMETDQDAIEAIQQAEAYEGLGKMIIAADKVEELQERYSSADGYGHHFGHYDGEELEIIVDDMTFHIFRVN